MKKFLIIAATLIITSCAIGAGENSRVIGGRNGFFPRLSGINLEGTKHQMPQTFKNKINVVVFYFTYEQQADAYDWFEIVEQVSKQYPEVSFYEIPVMNQKNVLLRGIINNELRRDAIDDEARKRTIAVYTDLEKFFKTMKMKEDQVYLLVVGENGKMMQRIEGGTSKENVELFKKKWSF
jgi:hypothetical protein